MEEGPRRDERAGGTLREEEDQRGGEAWLQKGLQCLMMPWKADRRGERPAEGAARRIRVQQRSAERPCARVPGKAEWGGWEAEQVVLVGAQSLMPQWKPGQRGRRRRHVRVRAH